MPKLTLNDILGGYQTAQAYNDNNALIEAAFDNTLSRDGTTPNQMESALDMNSNDIDNVNDLQVAGQLSTATFILNGQVVTTSTTLTGGLLAGEVSYTPTNPAGPLTTLQDALDDDYLRNDRAESPVGNWDITGTLDVSGLLTAAAGVTITTGDLVLSAGDITAVDATFSGAVDMGDLADPPAAPVTDHDRAGYLQLHNVAGGSINIPGSITENVWESVGPTGSGATNIWTELDDMPTTAGAILLSLDITVQCDGGGTGGMDVYLRKNGTGLGKNTKTHAASIASGGSTSGDIGTSVSEYIVAVDANGIFEINWDAINDTTRLGNCAYRGFIDGR